jgi:hypothetical protein
MALLITRIPHAGHFHTARSRFGWPLCRQLLLCAAVLTGLAVHAEDDTAALERRIKAAFLYKFAGYVEWPEGTFQKPDAPITIAVMGDDALADELSRLAAGHTVEGRPLVIRKQHDNELAAGTNVLFIGHAEANRLRARGNALLPVLIVTESDDALAQGSNINFIVSGGRVRFELSVENSEKRRLKLSSRLITVAQNMRQGAS